MLRGLSVGISIGEHWPEYQGRWSLRLERQAEGVQGGGKSSKICDGSFVMLQEN